MWFQVAECNAVKASLLLNLINNNFLIFNRESSQKSESVRPHSSNYIENATPLKSLQSWKCYPIQPHIPISLL